MIVDTSALVAIIKSDPGHAQLSDALSYGDFTVPAPVIVELHRVTNGRYALLRIEALALIGYLRGRGTVGEPFTNEDARIAVAANEQFGTGNGRGGTLNLLDLMVYAVAKRMGLPILCTGKDFAATDAAIHPASRIG